MADLKTSLIISLKERFIAPAKRIKRALDDISKAARLKGRLRLLARQSRKVAKEFKEMARNAGRLFKGMGILGGAALGVGVGFLRMAKGVAASGDSVAKTARKLGMGTEELQKWRFAAERSGIASNTFDMALQRFTRRAREAADGTGEAQGALKFLGVELKDGEGNLRDRTSLLDDVSEAMKKIEDPALRMRIAFKLFDSEGVNMVNLLGEGKDGMQALRKEAEELGVVTKENAKSSESYIDALTNFEQVIGSLRDSVVSGLLPGMTAWLKTQTELIKNGKQNFVGQLTQQIRSTVSSIAKFINTVNGIVDALGGWKTVLAAVSFIIGAKFLISLALMGKQLFFLGKTIFPFLIGAVKSLTAAMIANPIGLIVAGIAVAALLIIKFWKPITGFFKSLWGNVKAMFKDGILTGIVRLISALNPVTLFAKAFSGVLEFFTGFSLEEAGVALVASLRSGLESAWGGVLSWFRTKLSSFINLIPKPLRARLGINGFAADLAESVRQPNSAIPNQNAKAEVGGILKIQIDSAGRPSVARLEKNGGMDIEASTGVMMQGAG